MGSNTKDGLQQWKKDGDCLWKQLIDLTRPLFGATSAETTARTALEGKFWLLWARCPPDQVGHAMMDELFAFAETCRNLKELDDYLARPSFVKSLAPCAKTAETPFLPCFDYFQKFTVAPDPGLLTKEDKEDDFEKENKEFAKEAVQILQISDGPNQAYDTCKVCNSSSLGVRTTLQTRRSDEGSAQIWICGRANCKSINFK